MRRVQTRTQQEGLTESELAFREYWGNVAQVENDLIRENESRNEETVENISTSFQDNITIIESNNTNVEQEQEALRSSLPELGGQLHQLQQAHRNSNFWLNLYQNWSGSSWWETLLAGSSVVIVLTGSFVFIRYIIKNQNSHRIGVKFTEKLLKWLKK